MDRVFGGEMRDAVDNWINVRAAAIRKGCTQLLLRKRTAGDGFLDVYPQPWPGAG
jgi:hypothetical protein